MSSFIDELQAVVDAEWIKVKKGKFWTVAKENICPELYKETLIQIYNYTKHNSINQAVAAYKTDHTKIGLLRFMFNHAAEELGHENMTIRDLKSLGLATDEDFQKPALPATQALVGYLYHVSLELGGIARLGYSFWAEDSYHQFNDILTLARDTMGLTDENMTFFVAHSTIDAKHSDEVKREITRWVETDEDKELVKQVAITTIYLTGCILDQVADRFLESKQLESEAA